MLADTGERLIPEGNVRTLTYGEHISRYQSVLGMVKDKAVLDVATGTGYGAMMLSKNAKHVTAVDCSADALAYAQEHYGADNITYVEADAHSLPFENATFDVVVSFETIEHLKRPDIFVWEVKRVLKPDGVFCVSTPNDDEFMEGNTFHIHEFKLPELQEIIKKHFRNAKYYCQATYIGAALMNFDEMRAGGVVEEAVITFGQPESKAVYFLVVAGDSQLPLMKTNAVLADRWSTKEDYERDLVRNKEKQKLQKEVKILRQAADRNMLAYQTESKAFAKYRRRHLSYHVRRFAIAAKRRIIRK